MTFKPVAFLLADLGVAVRKAACTAHPHRFIGEPLEPPHLPIGSWINPPDQTEGATP
jgi:hypothetical protein